jgi:hypothetical protein
MSRIMSVLAAGLCLAGFGAVAVPDSRAAESDGLKAAPAEQAQTAVTDLSDRRRRRGRGGRRSVDQSGAAQENAQALAENRCDARDMVQVDWDFIERVVIPIGDQRQRLTDLKAVVAQADAQMVASCAIEARLTPTGRLEAMEKRLELRLEALKSLRAPLEAFYSALDDEQKARFVSATAQPGSARTFRDPSAQASEINEERRSRRGRRR